jgi:FMN-dependent NADH-azoreductase
MSARPQILQFHMRQRPESNTKAIKDAFLERFQSEVRNNAAKARDAFQQTHPYVNGHVCAGLCKLVQTTIRVFLLALITTLRL